MKTKGIHEKAVFQMLYRTPSVLLKWLRWKVSVLLIFYCEMKT